MLFFSVTVWLIFEGFNLWLLNWRYVGVEPRLWLRWLGYALAFATVLPGILLTAEVLASLGVGAKLRGPQRRFEGWQPGLSVSRGGVPGPAVSARPITASPSIWVAFLLLLDPVVDLLARRFPSSADFFGGGAGNPVSVAGRAGHLRPLVEELELLRHHQMGLHPAGAQFLEGLRDAAPGVSWVSPPLPWSARSCIISSLP